MYIHPVSAAPKYIGSVLSLGEPDPDGVSADDGLPTSDESCKPVCIESFSTLEEYKNMKRKKQPGLHPNVLDKINRPNVKPLSSIESTQSSFISVSFFTIFFFLFSRCLTISPSPTFIRVDNVLIFYFYSIITLL